MWLSRIIFSVVIGFSSVVSVAADPAPVSTVLFQNVRVFNGIARELSAPCHVLIRGNVIEKVSAEPIPLGHNAMTKVIDGTGKTLMPGLIDAHTHLMFANLSPAEIATADVGFINVAATKTAHEYLMMGYTSVRDVGGPVLGLKRGIDAGLVPGPRIWPCGAMISQSGGHGDFRLPTEMPAPPESFAYSERIGAAAIADTPDLVRKRVREQLALGATQIKLMAGGGVASSYDPLDVTQYSAEELRAAVEAAENWGTYVTVHAYTPRAVRQSIEAGVKCIEHGQLLDDATAKLMAEKGVWWSLQPFIDEGKSAFAEGSANRRKQLQMYAGTDTAYLLAKKYKIKTAFGNDALFRERVGVNIAKMIRWYTPAEALKMATADNAELLGLSGPRTAYAGKLGVVEEGALADLLLVNGNPLSDLLILENPAKTLSVIMKDGKVYKE